MEYHSDRAQNPERIFFDINHARPWINHKRIATREINDGLVSRIRMAETAPGTTARGSDLTGKDEYTVSTLSAPDRIVIELTPTTGEIRDGETVTGLLCRAHAAHSRRRFAFVISCAGCASTSAHAPAGQHAAGSLNPIR